MSDQQHWIRPRQWPVGIGHNGGPPLDDDGELPGKLLFVRHCWEVAYAEAWKAPSRDILLFRLRRAEAARLSYEDYMLRLLATGRHPQAGDPAPHDNEETPKS